MAARQLLPLYGGSAAVWITCLVFFQLALLAGYSYAHLLANRRTRPWLWLHHSLLAAAVACACRWGSGTHDFPATAPVLGIFLRLTAWIGIPFLVLGATSPLLQVWQRRLTGGAVPYSLYGWSNAASLTALIAYPALLEPLLSLHTQRLCWAAALTLFALLQSALAWKSSGCPIPDGPTVISRNTRSPHTPRQRLLWFALALIGTMQLSAITEHLTRNVAALPLLWVLPLGVYLATFIFAFQDRFRLPRLALAGVCAVMLIAVGNFVAQPQYGLPVGLGIGLFLVELAVACLFCHTELYRLRPAGDHDATAFYLTIAAGGAAGSMLIGIVAPLVFRANYDLSLTLAATAAVAIAVAWPTGPRPRMLWAGCTAILLVLVVQLHGAYARDTLATERNFYGSLRVTERSVAGIPTRTLLHGTIMHGTELFSPGGNVNPLLPTAYFAPDSGGGLALAGCYLPDETVVSGNTPCPRPRQIGVVGLGVGTLAAYGRPSDTFRFYELNPAVQPLARTFFTYLARTPAQVAIADGDGRALLTREPAHHFDVLVLDAFSGDAIPLHLLTVEAVHVYRRQLAPGGILAFHISNQYVDLEPELRELALASGFEARGVDAPANPATGAFESHWVLMTTRPGWLEALGNKAHPLRQLPGLKPWTDNYSSLLRLLRW